MASWNVASDVQLWDNSGVWKSAVSTTSTVTAGAYQIGSTSVINASRQLINIADMTLTGTGSIVTAGTNTSMTIGTSTSGSTGLLKLQATGDIKLFQYGTSWTTNVTFKGDGFVGVGTEDPQAKIHVADSKGSGGDLWTQVGAGNAPGIHLQNSANVANTNAVIYFRNSSAEKASIGARFVNQSTGETELRFSTTNSSGTSRERVTLDGAGTLIVGKNTANSSATTPNITSAEDDTTATTTSYHINFTRSSANSTGRIGGITSNYYSTSYATSSDYRLKENVNYDWDATSRLKQLRPCQFTWIGDTTNVLIDGFLAHEVEDIVEDAVVGEKDATREVDGETVIDPQSIDQAKLVPLLVKTIQELEARIAALEAQNS